MMMIDSPEAGLDPGSQFMGSLLLARLLVVHRPLSEAFNPPFVGGGLNQTVFR